MMGDFFSVHHVCYKSIVGLDSCRSKRVGTVVVRDLCESEALRCHSEISVFGVIFVVCVVVWVTCYREG